MSYFDSILASVGFDVDGKSDPSAASASAKTSSRPSNVSSDIPASSRSTAAKRKADGELTSTTKAQKIGSHGKGDVMNPSTKNITVPSTSLSLAESQPRSEVALESKKKPAKAVMPSNLNSGSQQTAPTSKSTNQPAHGSLAALLARAKSMQNTKLGQGGGFINKSATKSQEEVKENRKRILEARRSRGPISRMKIGSRSESEGPPAQKKAPRNKKVPVEEKPKRKPVEVAYKGTMRGPATQPTYRGTANLKTTGDGRKEDRYGGYRYRRDHSNSAEEDEEDYDSEASSDMEAGAWDIDEEEELTLRAARKEDAREQRLEEELKRKKLLRKQGL